MFGKRGSTGEGRPVQEFRALALETALPTNHASLAAEPAKLPRDIAEVKR